MPAKAIIPSAQPPIADVEWKFSSITNKEDNLPELREFLVYEYAREQKWIIDAISQCKKNSATYSHIKSEGDLSLGDFECRKVRIDKSALRQRWREKGKAANGSGEKLEIAFKIEVRLGMFSTQHRPFIDYDRTITLDAKFPSPYLSDPGHFALMEMCDAVSRPPVEDLKRWSVRVTAAELLNGHHIQDSKMQERILVTFTADNGRIVSERNGLPLNFPKDEISVFRFALGIDFSLPNEVLQDAFGKFLAAARRDYKLPTPRLNHGYRPSRGGTLKWAKRTCWDALYCLAAHRIVTAFGKKKQDAYKYYTNNRGSNYPTYQSCKEFIRAADRYTDTAKYLFEGVEKKL